MAKSSQNLIRLAVSAGLLWFDTKLFLFFMFAILLYDLDYLRAVLRVTHAESELWIRALGERMGADLSDENAKRIMRELQDQTPPGVWASLIRDWRRVHHS